MPKLLPTVLILVLTCIIIVINSVRVNDLHSNNSDNFKEETYTSPSVNIEKKADTSMKSYSHVYTDDSTDTSYEFIELN